MTTLKITPAKLNGSVCVPSSKSMGHREIICAGLSAGTSIVDNISMSDDMEATLRCLTALGIGFQKVPSEDQDAQLWLLMAVVMYEFRKVLPIAENQVRH